MIVILKPAIIAYKVSEVATPNPEINPDFQVLLTVLFMQRTPKGPNGIETMIPMMMPSNNKVKLMVAKIAENIITHYNNEKKERRDKISYF